MIILPVPPPPDSILYSDPSEQKQSPERLRTLRCPFLCFAAACVKFLKIRAGGFANPGGFMLYLS